MTLPGIDLSRTMVKIGRQKIAEEGLKASIIQDDAVEVLPDLKRESFDVIISLFGVVDYFLNGNTLKRLFKNIRKKMTENSLLIVDFMSSDFFRYRASKTGVLEAENNDQKCLRVYRSRVDVKRKRIFMNFDCVVHGDRNLIDQFRESHELRLFTMDDIADIGRESDLKQTSTTERGTYIRTTFVRC